jgi:drug/metabolite transporter (DMT)-like permease
MKIFLILLTSSLSIASQLNLKSTSSLIPTTFDALTNLGYLKFILLLGRVGAISGLSLLVTWICYRNFDFLELFAAQAIVYVFAVAASYFLLNEPLTWNKLVSVSLIIMGICCFYAPTSQS